MGRALFEIAEPPAIFYCIESCGWIAVPADNSGNNRPHVKQHNLSGDSKISGGLCWNISVTLFQEYTERDLARTTM